jgi:hypothetical protein
MPREPRRRVRRERRGPRDDGSRVDFFHKYWPIEFVRWDEILQMFVTRVDPETVAPGDMLQQNSALGYIGSYEVPITTATGGGRSTRTTRVTRSSRRRRSFRRSRCGRATRSRSATGRRAPSRTATRSSSARCPKASRSRTGRASPPEATAMVMLLRDLASGDTPVGIRPAKSKTDMVTNTSTAWQVWNELVGNGEKAAARIYLGTDGTLGTHRRRAGHRHLRSLRRRRHEGEGGPRMHSALVRRGRDRTVGRAQLRRLLARADAPLHAAGRGRRPPSATRLRSVVRTSSPTSRR